MLLEDRTAVAYVPITVQRRLPLREAGLLLFYHFRLLNWRLFLLMLLGFAAAGALLWFQLSLDDPQRGAQAAQLSRFVMETGTGLFAAMFASSLVIGDPLLEVMMATRGGIREALLWRALLLYILLLLTPALYLFWSLGNGVSYAHQQSPLFLLLIWLVPVLIMGMLGLFGSLLTRNAALGMVIAAVPLMGALFLYAFLLPNQASHPFLIPYTFWGYDASDWWTNRLTLLGIVAVLAPGCWWLLRLEERLLGKSQ